MNKPANLLIVRTDRIGDVVLSLPLASIVKAHYPECKVTFLLREYTKELALRHPDINQIILLKENEGKVPLLDNVKQIRKEKYDTCIVVYPTFIISLIIFLSRIKLRIGSGYRWYSFLFSKKVFVHRKYAEKHELAFNVELLKEIGIDEQVNKDNVTFKLRTDEKSKYKIEELLLENNIKNSEPIIIIHPGSGGSAADLPIDKFKELIAMLVSGTTANIILTGNKNEIALCSQLVISDRVKNLAGMLDLSMLIALIDESDVFVANSTGPLHIAAALGKYVIGFYPHKLECSAKRWGPYTNKGYVFTPNPGCTDCAREQCGKSECMSTIKVTDVFDQIEKICKILVNNGEFNG